jgi:hypothetical protein
MIETAPASPLRTLASYAPSLVEKPDNARTNGFALTITKKQRKPRRNLARDFDVMRPGWAKSKTASVTRGNKGVGEERAEAGERAEEEDNLLPVMKAEA